MGKSELISRRMPAFAFGRRNPDLRIIGTSYAADRAWDFSRDVQRIIDSESYQRIFPTTTINGEFGRYRNAKRDVDLFEIVGQERFIQMIRSTGNLSTGACLSEFRSLSTPT